MAATLSTTSCNDWLDVLPNNEQALATADPLCVLMVTPIDFTPVRLCVVLWWQIYDVIIHQRTPLVNGSKLY